MVTEVVYETSADINRLSWLSAEEDYIEHILLLSSVGTVIFHVLHYCSGPIDKVLPVSVQILILCSCQHSSSRGFEVLYSYMIKSSVFL